MANQFNGVWKIFSIIVLEDMNFSMKKYESLTILHKSLALSAHASPQTIHFQVLDQSPVSGPGRGPPSCNKWQLWRGLFFAETDILTTRGTQGPACLPMDQTQRPQLGPCCPWSPPDADNWPECPDR